MKKKIYYGIAVILFATTLISWNSGTPGGKTGSPQDGGLTCTQCHGGTASLQDAWITSNIPVEGYTPGETYSFTAIGTHTGAAKFGFEITSENASSKVGTFVVTDAVTTKLDNGSKAITHTSDNTTTTGTKEWSFDWTAPTEGTGDITFYGAFNAANGNSGTSGDVIYTSELLVSESTVGIEKNNSNIITLAPNPANNYVTVNSKELIYSIDLFNISGKKVKSISNVYNINKRLNLSNFPKGVYFIKINNKDAATTSKLIIE